MWKRLLWYGAIGGYGVAPLRVHHRTMAHIAVMGQRLVHQFHSETQCTPYGRVGYLHYRSLRTKSSNIFQSKSIISQQKGANMCCSGVKTECCTQQTRCCASCNCGSAASSVASPARVFNGNCADMISCCAPLVATPAPDFKTMSVMPDGSFKEVALSDFKGMKYVMLFFYPMDFTFVCPSEIIAFHKKSAEFESRNVQLLGCSVDSHFTHNAWRNTDPSNGGIGKISFPLLADMTKSVSASYGVLLPDGVALRGLFLIDKEGTLQHALVNNLPIGRSVDEAIRVVDALQFTEKHGEVCPANWKKGDKAMKATAEGVAAYLKESS